MKPGAFGDNVTVVLQGNPQLRVSPDESGFARESNRAAGARAHRDEQLARCPAAGAERFRSDGDRHRHRSFHRPLRALPPGPETPGRVSSQVLGDEWGGTLVSPAQEIYGQVWKHSPTPSRVVRPMHRCRPLWPASISTSPPNAVRRERPTLDCGCSWISGRRGDDPRQPARQNPDAVHQPDRTAAPGPGRSTCRSRKLCERDRGRVLDRLSEGRPDARVDHDRAPLRRRSGFQHGERGLLIGSLKKTTSERRPNNSAAWCTLGCRRPATPTPPPTIPEPWRSAKTKRTGCTNALPDRISSRTQSVRCRSNSMRRRTTRLTPFHASTSWVTQPASARSGWTRCGIWSSASFWLSLFRSRSPLPSTASSNGVGRTQRQRN